MGRIERRKRETWLQFLWMVSDAVAIIVSFPAAYWLRFHSPLTQWIPVTRGVPPIEPYLTAGLVLTLAWLPLFYALGLYHVEVVGPRTRGTLRTVGAVAIAVVVGAALTFFYRGFSFSRAFFPLLFVAVSFFVLGGRRLTRLLTRRWRRRAPIRLALVGQSPSGLALAARLREYDPVGVEVCGWFTTEDPATDSLPEGPRESGSTMTDPVPDLPELNLLGRWEDVAEAVLERRLDVLILALTLRDSELAADVVMACRGLPVDIEMVPDTLQLLSRRARVREVDGLPILSLREFPLTGWNGVLKRTFDLVLSASALIVLAPVFLILAIAVKLSSPGPVFYAQDRMGRDGRHFRILKFRSMRLDAEDKSGPVWAVVNDDRRTRVGTFIREWSLDELPQLLNVLKGEMSLVGPRPERPFFVSRFSADMPEYLDRHRVKSGITGWAQVNGLRGDTSIEERTRYDVYYVENWSIAFDVKILWLTVRTVLTRHHAY